ncbi:MAG TPA: lysophospholipid acyltransferase family protein [Pseudomonadales bacterium]|nr:lysophospholipid acyltransferase family protein [Pseudomonadales bacterium]
MKARHLFRAASGFIQFIGVVLVAFIDYPFFCAFHGKEPKPMVRAQWLQRHCRRALKIFNATISVSGSIPASGLLVSNHLSYLDILVISSISPAVFVAKREVKSWPVVGWLTQMAGSIFVNREQKTQVAEINEKIETAFNSGVLIVLFPEGTSSDGSTLLPFKSALLEPAAQQAHCLTAGFLEYTLDDGDAASEICYWGDHTFFPHLLNLLGLRGFRIVMRLAPFEPANTDRKELARLLRAEILRLKEDCASSTFCR